MSESIYAETTTDEEIKRGFGVLCITCDSEILLGLIHLGSDAPVSELRAKVDLTTQPKEVDCPVEVWHESTPVEKDRIVFVDVKGWVFQPMANVRTPG